MKIIELPQIQQTINMAADLDDLLNTQKAAFLDFSAGLYNVPLPMQFSFPKYRSDCHIKGGYKQNSKHLVIKIANGSPFGGTGVILVFAADTGELKAILRDNGWLTTLRTALAGIIASELVPWQIENIGIIGSGSLAKMLYDLVSLKYPHKPITLYARNHDKALNITDNICVCAEELIKKCDLIFTATSSDIPIIEDIDLNSHMAIIALGSDDEHKKELSLGLFGKSNVVLVDSKMQALKFGDVARSLSSGVLSQDSLTEIGNALKSGIPEEAKIIIADFSGIGAQDVAMTEFILSRLCI